MWKATLAKLEQHDNKMIESWKDELNSLLVFVSGIDALLLFADIGITGRPVLSGGHHVHR